MSDIIAENERYRVRLVLDEYQHQPDGDCYAPTFRISSHHMEWLSPDPGGENVADAVLRWGSPAHDGWRMTEKYLRGILGATTVQYFYSGSYWYVSYDSAAWREAMGITRPVTEDLLHDWEMWSNGEVYGYVLEEKVQVHTVRKHADGSTFHESDSEEWVENDSCWGYYGFGYARDTAQEVFDYTVGRAAQ